LRIENLRSGYEKWVISAMCEKWVISAMCEKWVISAMCEKWVISAMCTDQSKPIVQGPV
jgi:hypothetical protein